MNRGNKITLILLAMLTALILWHARGFFAPWYDKPGFNESFDSKQWQQNKDILEQDNPRGKMVRSLLRNYRLKNKTRQEIINLLGKPEELGDEDTNLLKAREFTYVLGWYSGLRMEPDYMSIYFDKNGKVVKYDIWQS